MTEGRVLQLGQSKKKEAEPVFTYVIVLRNGQIIEQRATTWCELSGEEEGINYSFYMHKIRVLTLEYTEIRSILCSEHCDVSAAIKALNYEKPKPKRKKKVAL